MRPNGVSLIELVIVLVILGILVVFLAPILTGAVSSYDYTSRNVELLTNMRYAMERVAREIRSVRRDQLDSGSYDITTMTSTKLEFCRSDGYRVTIEKPAASTTVTLGYTSGFSAACSASATSFPTLTDNVSAFSLTYVTSTGGSATDSSNVAYVDLGLTVSRTGANSYSSAMRVDMRNP